MWFKKFLPFIFCLFFGVTAHAEQIINVEYIHKLIEQEHELVVPYSDKLKSVKQAANTEYMLKIVDIANEMLNGEKITDYGNSEFATTQAIDTVAGIYAVRDFIRHYYFTATTTPATEEFGFTISASGLFHIDWGDGTRESFRKNKVGNVEYSHEYDVPGEYRVKIGGYATGYDLGLNTSAISFSDVKYNMNLAKIEGNLGKIFSTLKESTTTQTQPKFRSIFYN